MNFKVKYQLVKAGFGNGFKETGSLSIGHAMSSFDHLDIVSSFYPRLSTCVYLYSKLRVLFLCFTFSSRQSPLYVCPLLTIKGSFILLQPLTAFGLLGSFY